MPKYLHTLLVAAVLSMGFTQDGARPTPASNRRAH